MAYIDALPATSALHPAADVQDSGMEEKQLLRRFVGPHGDIYVEACAETISTVSKQLVQPGRRLSELAGYISSRLP
jgi:hypothetical protein